MIQNHYYAIDLGDAQAKKIREDLNTMRPSELAFYELGLADGYSGTQRTENELIALPTFQKGWNDAQAHRTMAMNGHQSDDIFYRIGYQLGEQWIIQATMKRVYPEMFQA